MVEKYDASIRNFYLKTRFVKGKMHQPFNDQLILSLSALIHACRILNAVIYTTLQYRAFHTSETRISFRVKNFKFRSLIAWIKTLSANDKTQLNSFSFPKVVVQLKLTNAQDLDAGKLGQWIAFRRTDPSPDIGYKFRIVKNARELAMQLVRAKQAVGENLEMNRLTAAEISCVQMWEAEVKERSNIMAQRAGGTRDVKTMPDWDAGEDNDRDMWGPDDEIVRDGDVEMEDGDEDEEESESGDEESEDGDEDGEEMDE